MFSPFLTSPMAKLMIFPLLPTFLAKLRFLPFQHLPALMLWLLMDETMMVLLLLLLLLLLLASLARKTFSGFLTKLA